jgi:hypothetical protein
VIAETLWGEEVAWAPEPQAEPEPGEAAAEPGPDQLSFGENQPAIWDAEPEPRQLALLPDPEPWEADRPSPAGAPPGRLARRRARAAPPDQLSLF